jgi:DNA-binding LacI/PurR family transcriptional regulator
VGFDNVTLSGLARISLTTVAQPLDELARLGLEHLVDRIEREHGDSPRHATRPRVTTVPVELVVRGSTAPPPRQSSATAVK